MLVGITGRKRAGKDTLAAVLTSEYGFKRFAFADVMKDFALALDPLIFGQDYCFDNQPEVRLSDIVREEGWEGAKEYDEVRRTLQRLGTEAGRGIFGEDFWVERTAADIAASGAPRIVITDVRFPNEAAWVRARGGTLVRVLRLDQPPRSNEHVSEHALDDVPADVTVSAGNPMELRAKARDLAVRLRL